MGVEKEMQMLKTASLFAVLSSIFGWYSYNSYMADKLWIEIIPLGVPTLFFVTMTIVCLDIWHLKPADSHTYKTLLSQYRVLLYLRISKPYARWMIKKKTMEPKKVNEESLLNILRKNQDTVYGKEYRFSEMKSREDFVNIHPLTTAEHYQSYVHRIMAGENNVLYPGETFAIISTSGTTGYSKVFAVIKEYAEAVKDLLYSLSMSTVVSFLNLQRSAQFHIYSPMKETEAGICMGAGSQLILSGKCFNLIPQIYSKLYLEDTSYYAQAVFSLAERELGVIIGFSADLMFSYWKFIVENWDHFCEDINNGYIGKHINMPQDIKDELSKYLKADPARAKELRNAMQSGVVGLVKRIWPGISFVQMGKSAAFKMCAEILMENHFKGVKVIGIWHAATEGITGLNFEELDPHVGEVLTLILYPSFVEFIRLEDVEKQNPDTIFPEQLELGGMYEVVHTTMNGLYRCHYGDIIKVVGFHNKTPKYEFQYRLGQRLNIAYERTPDKFLYEAIQECEKYFPPGVNLMQYTTTESTALEKLTGPLGKGHYVFFMEFDKDTDVNCSILGNEIDKALMRLYQQYKHFKDMECIGPLKVMQVKCGTFEHLKSIIWNNNPNSAFKMPRVLRREAALKFLLKQALST